MIFSDYLQKDVFVFLFERYFWLVGVLELS